jgi:hypothetical protein
MTGSQWLLASTLTVIYLALLFTAGYATFRKGHLVLLIVGIVLPFLWFIGAVLPSRRPPAI